MPTYVQHEVLGRIPDVFNAEAIWQAPGLALFARRPLLRDLLERCPREQRGRAATRCFAHVTLRLPQEDVDDDYHLTRGNRARELTDTLAALHRKDFGDLLGNDDVRYHVIGADDLATGEIEVRFGHAVYLPAPDEKVLFDVTASSDGATWHSVCPVYPQQRLALIGDAPGWPFGTDGVLLLINDGPDAEPVLQVRPKGAFDCRLDAAGHYTVTSRQGGKRLLLKITRSGTAPVRVAPPAVWQPRTRPDASPRADEPTALPLAAMRTETASDATYAPGARGRLALAALALPRLSRYRSTGVTRLELPFDCTLGFAVNVMPAVTIAVDATDTLQVVTRDDSMSLELPCTCATHGEHALHVTSVPAAMAERYSAMVALPQPVMAPVSAKGVFGRGSPALAALRVLETARCMTGADSAASPDRIGLSRSAFSFEPSAQGLLLLRQSANQALYHLDAALGYIGMIDAAEGDEPFVLPPGHHVVAGHYVLRYDA
ncbi:hypothetical protein ACFFTM_14425 [Pseudoduganella plicata]|uniref:Baseplate protein J-like domain-containing protein n=1 Tax=Pseudoduganella plicata TaxID=321984 RepID=A0A4P7B8U3_9BURK|nr:hypothetical protein [Pseudoduganella plicata]QBQ34891.1 hypothetical protein E1742_00835 [Pseudoduganella plicata]GGY89366.1 hypothetical protein GCM10007388_23580 [Pseudoduganella plicata]